MESFGYQQCDSNHLQKLSSNIASNIQKISQNVKSIQQLVNQLGTDQDNSQLRSQLHQVQHYTGGLAKDTNTELRSLQYGPVLQGEDTKAWQMQAERLTREFTQALNNFQSVQRQAATKEKEALKEAKAHKDLHYFDHGPTMVDIGRSSRQNEMQIQMEQEVEIHVMQERESHIKQLESDIIDVNQIFKDLATMVHEQGEVIDSIEANVESTSVHVSQGAGQLRQAQGYQTKSRKKKLCLIVAILSVIIVIIIIIAVKK